MNSNDVKQMAVVMGALLGAAGIIMLVTVVSITLIV